MSDLKTPFTNPVVPTPDLGGSGVTARGGDPLIDTGGDGAAKPLGWENPIVPTPGGSETANSVSGLPTQPSRFEPSGSPPEPPSLMDRSPRTFGGK